MTPSYTKERLDFIDVLCNEHDTHCLPAENVVYERPSLRLERLQFDDHCTISVYLEIEARENLVPSCIRPSTALIPDALTSTALRSGHVKRRRAEASSICLFSRNAGQPVNRQAKLPSSAEEWYFPSGSIQREWQASLHCFDSWTKTRTFPKIREGVCKIVALAPISPKETREVNVLYSHTTIMPNI